MKTYFNMLVIELLLYIFEKHNFKKKIRGSEGKIKNLLSIKVCPIPKVSS